MPSELDRMSHAVLKRAIEIDASGRRIFVEEACGGDAALLARVLMLIKALDHSRGFLEKPALGTANGRPNGAIGHDSMPPDTVIGDYRILRVIGSGGMATVYEALQDQPRRNVALKVMRRGMERTSALHRFKFETEVLARLRHPGIAQIFEAGTSRDGHGASIPFFAMEHVEGARTITAYASEHGITLPERLAMFAAVCDAVQHGHKSGVIHRDLKPSNILVDTGGHPKVIDFGVARASDPDQAWITRHADLGQLIGTLNYMSPEQCDGEAEVDIRADVYSLGIVLYELVAGRLPHDLSRFPVPEALRIVRDVAPARPSAVNPVCRGDIDAIVMKAIDKEPDRRYPTAAALATDIRRYLRCETIEARPPTMFYQWRLFARRNRTLVAAMVALAVAIVGGGVLSAAFGYHAVRESRRRLAAETLAIQERDAAVWQGYIANIAAALAAFNTGEVHQTRARLANAAPRHRGWEWRFISGLAERTLATVVAHDDMIHGFASTDDGRWIATGCRDGSIRIWSTATLSDPVEIAGTGSRIISVAFSPDGRRLVSGGDDRVVRIWDCANGAELESMGEHASRILSVAWGNNGIIASASTEGNGRLWRAQTGELLADLNDQPGGVHGVSFSSGGERLMTWNWRGSIWVRSADGAEVHHRLEVPGDVFCAVTTDDNTVLAAGADGGHIVLWDLQTGERLHHLQLLGSISAVRALAFTPDGRLLASGHGDRTIALWSVADGEQQLPLLRGHEETIAGLHISPDGERLISASWDRTIRLWSLEGERPAELITALRGHENRVMTARFSPDGSLIASGSIDSTVRLWDTEHGNMLGVLRGHEDALRAVCFSPDGRLIASAADDRTLRLWDAVIGLERLTIPNPGGAVNCITFSPDGAALAFGEGRLVRIWDLAAMRDDRSMEGHTDIVRAIAFSPDGRTIASASNDQSVRLWDAETGAVRRILPAHDAAATALVFSADGRTLYTGSRDQTVRAWCMETFESRILGGHGQFVTGLALSPDGTRLAAGSWFGEIVLWDLQTHDIVLSFKAHPTVIREVDFDPRGRWLASASYDQTIRLYDSLPPRERKARRAEIAAHARDAAALVEALFREHRTPALVAEALDARDDLGPDARAEARKAILIRALQPTQAPAAAP